MVISRVHLFLEFSAEKCQSGFANEVSRRYIYPFRVRVMTSLCKELRQYCANLSGALFIDRMAADRSTCCSGLKTVYCNLARWKPFFSHQSPRPCLSRTEGRHQASERPVRAVAWKREIRRLMIYARNTLCVRAYVAQMNLNRWLPTYSSPRHSW